MVRRASLIVAVLVALAADAMAAGSGADRKLDAALRQRALAPRGTSRVIVRTLDGAPADAALRTVDARPGRHLRGLGAQVAEVPDAALETLASHPSVRAVSLDRTVRGTLERTAATVGATWVSEQLGLDGSGIGVAMIDSGVAGWHDDLTGRVVRFVDFVNHQPLAYDDYGHGTHVAGIIAGSGHDSAGARRGIAPGAHLVALKVLDGSGDGYISNVIAALDYAVQMRAALNIRVINISVAAGVYESYDSDPLTLAAKRAVEAGIVVVTAAGNLGRNAKGQTQFGGITAPGNAPWVLTVGASSHNGTDDRDDDTIAAFSSRGPAAIDYSAKPDLVAPGVGTESTTDADSLLFATRPASRLWGTVPTAAQPYLSLSGTSMAAPVVAGTVALMLQANPSLTPNAVKAILQFTAEDNRKYNLLAQGAGFLNARGAVAYARTFKADGKTDGSAAQADGDQPAWSRHITWGNHRIGGGMLTADASAWRQDVTWGAATTALGDRVTWGVLCAGSDAGCQDASEPAAEGGDNIVWGTSCAPDDPDCDNIVWGTGDDENIVWGTDCGGNDCENIVWGTAAACDPEDPDCDNIVWGTADERDNIVWGTSCAPDEPACDNIVWGTMVGADRVVWGRRPRRPALRPVPVTHEGGRQ
jgi:serine protease AprX